MDSPEIVTKPGYQVCSSSFIVEFVAGGWKEEEENNWHHMMVQLVNAFEKWPKDMARVEREAVDSNLSIKRVEIFDTLSRIKKVHVHVDPEDLPHQRLTLLFEVRSKKSY